MNSIQMVFKNGVESPLFKGIANQLDEDDLRVINIRRSEKIRHVSMLVDTAMWYSGIRMYDEEFSLLIDEIWSNDHENAEWSQL